MVGLAVFFLAFWFLAYREKNTLELMGPFIAALALSVLYNHIIAPWLTLTINGYWPDFKYQQLPWSDLAEEPLFFLSQGALLYMDTVRFFLGNIPRWAAVIVVLGLGCAAVLTGPARQKNKPFVTAVLGFFLSQTVLIWVMLTLMLLRHGGLRWPDVRRVYYFLPILAMLCMTLLVALAHFSTPRKWLVAFLLGGAIVGNILALPRHDAILREGSLRANFQSTPALLDALRNLHNHQYPVSPEISRNRVFQFFHDGYFVKEPLLLPRDKDNAAPKKNPRA
jgi:hypothetical protein